MNVPTYLFALYDFWPFFNRPPYDGFQIWIKLSPLLGFEPWTYPIANRRANLWAMTTWFKSKVKFPPSIFAENFSSWHIFHILMRSFTPDLLPVKVFIVLVNFLLGKSNILLLFALDLFSHRIFSLDNRTVEF